MTTCPLRLEPYTPFICLHLFDVLDICLRYDLMPFCVLNPTTLSPACSCLRFRTSACSTQQRTWVPGMKGDCWRSTATCSPALRWVAASHWQGSEGLQRLIGCLWRNREAKSELYCSLQSGFEVRCNLQLAEERRMA